MQIRASYLPPPQRGCTPCSMLTVDKMPGTHLLLPASMIKLHADCVMCTQSAQKLQSNTGLSADAAFTADITDESLSGLTAAMEGVDALVISTSAKPQLVVSSLPKAWLHQQMLAAQHDHVPSHYGQPCMFLLATGDFVPWERKQAHDCQNSMASSVQPLAFIELHFIDVGRCSIRLTQSHITRVDLVGMCVQSIWNKIRGASAMPDFYYNQTPEQVLQVLLACACQNCQAGESCLKSFVI